MRKSFPVFGFLGHLSSLSLWAFEDPQGFERMPQCGVRRERSGFRFVPVFGGVGRLREVRGSWALGLRMTLSK